MPERLPCPRRRGYTYVAFRRCARLGCCNLLADKGYRPPRFCGATCNRWALRHPGEVPPAEDFVPLQRYVFRATVPIGALLERKPDATFFLACG
jgi:hypothetical protein